ELAGAITIAEGAVRQMPEGAMKLAAFQTVLQELLQRQRTSTVGSHQPSEPERAPRKRPALLPSTGTTGRLMGLIEEGFFSQQRSLPEIRQVLSERGWHYKPEDIGTPVTRLVRQKRLRRVRVAEGGKKLWRYSSH
ncbi:MAG: hypothetical protein WA817_06895, partial [Candidatus Acidiferrum sp.]